MKAAARANPASRCTQQLTLEHFPGSCRRLNLNSVLGHCCTGMQHCCPRVLHTGTSPATAKRGRPTATPYARAVRDPHRKGEHPDGLQPSCCTADAGLTVPPSPSSFTAPSSHIHASWVRVLAVSTRHRASARTHYPENSTLRVSSRPTPKRPRPVQRCKKVNMRKVGDGPHKIRVCWLWGCRNAHLGSYGQDRGWRQWQGNSREVVWNPSLRAANALRSANMVISGAGSDSLAAEGNPFRLVT
jgi:hypothetical protein